MADYLALDWDDQRLVGVAAHVASKNVQVRAVLDFKWAEGEIPSEQPGAAGKRLRAELDLVSASNGPVIVSLPREEAIVRLLELPECSDEELPELVRFQAVTRSAVPLEKLLLDYLPLPAREEAPGRRVWMATIGKPFADRVQTLLSAAGLQAEAIGLSSLGAAELIAHQTGASGAAADPAIVVVTCVDQRVEVTAIWQSRIVLMHSATLSAHDTPEDQLAQILAETARATVALSQAAPGVQIGSGWLIGARADRSPLAEKLSERFEFKFHLLTDPASTPGVTNEAGSALLDAPLAWPALGLLLEHTNQQIDAVDFLHPRRQHPKPDRRKLYMILGAVAAVLLLIGIWGAIQRKVWQLDDDIAKIDASNKQAQDLLKKNAPLLETAGSVDDWTQRDIDWLEQFRVIEQAKGGADKLYLTMFDANVGTRDRLATIVAAGRAKLPNEVDDFEDHLHDQGFRVTPKEISEDTSDRLYPVKIDLNLDIVPKSAGAAEPKAGPGITRPGAHPPATPSNSSSAPASAPATSTPPPASTASNTPAPAAPNPAPAAAASPQQAVNEPVQTPTAVQPANGQQSDNPMPMPEVEGQPAMDTGTNGPSPMPEPPTSKG